MPDNKLDGQVNNYGFRAPLLLIFEEERQDMDSAVRFARDKGYEGKELVMGIRPEDIHSEQMFLETFPENVVNAEVVVSELLGAETQLYTKIGEMEVICKVDSRDFVKPGATIKLGFDMNKAHFFDPETEVNLDLE